MLNNLFAIMVSFGKIGLISLGGGGSMLKLLEYEAVNYRHWIGPEEFASMIGTSFLFPGLTVIKLSALIGYKAEGILGMLVAIICLNLPGLVMALVGYQFISSYNGPFARKVMVGVQYGALALLAAAVFAVAQSVTDMYFSLLVAIATFIFFIGLVYFQISPFWGFLVFIAVCFFLVKPT